VSPTGTKTPARAKSGRREEKEMLEVAIEVQSGTARFGVAVQAQSIQRALGLIEARFPGSTCRVKFPIEAEGFFVEAAGARAGIVEQAKKLAA
jgi:hypothetical protein